MFQEAIVTSTSTMIVRGRVISGGPYEPTDHEPTSLVHSFAHGTHLLAGHELQSPDPSPTCTVHLNP